ncbi:MAG: acetate--CoA ligase alpha subunit [Candidatus Hodarchaeales archaeon]
MTLENFFHPNAIAIVGASRHPGSVGYSIVNNILSDNFSGSVYPVNPKADLIQGIKCYKSLSEIDDVIDLAVVAVPARIVNIILEEAGKIGVKSAIIITAGFREVGDAGLELENQMITIADKYNIKILGPNTLGLISTPNSLNASFAATTALKGKIAFMSQSGAFCTATLDWSKSVGVGFSHFVSLGNKVKNCGVSEIDLLKYWKDDPETKVILAYLEEISNGQEFMKVAREVTESKPVVIIKSGRTTAGAKAASSHTGSLAGSDIAYEALFKQSAVLRAYDTEELFDYAVALALMPLPTSLSPGIAIVTNAGGFGIMATDATEQAGLRLAPVSDETIEKLKNVLPATASFRNPIDLIGDATPEIYQKALEILIKDPFMEGIIVLLSPQAQTNPPEIAKKIVMLVKKKEKPVLCSFSGGISVEDARKHLMTNGVPVYPFPERAVRAMGVLTKYNQLRSELEEKEPINLVINNQNKKKVKNLIKSVKADLRTTLTEQEAKQIASLYGIPVPKEDLARLKLEAIEIANKLGYPIVMKIVSPDIMHKTDVGGVKLNITQDNEVAKYFDEIILSSRSKVPNADIKGILITEFLPKAKEFFIGMTRDPQVGPLIAVGLGGIYVEVMKDVTFRVAPISLADGRSMLEELRSYPLLTGVRGEKPADINAIVDILNRICKLAMDFEEIVEIDINPLFVYEKESKKLPNKRTVIALDVKMVVK